MLSSISFFEFASIVSEFLNRPLKNFSISFIHEIKIEYLEFSGGEGFELELVEELALDAEVGFEVHHDVLGHVTPPHEVDFLISA